MGLGHPRNRRGEGRVALKPSFRGEDCCDLILVSMVLRMTQTRPRLIRYLVTLASPRVGNESSQANHFSACSVHFMRTSWRFTQYVCYKLGRIDSELARYQSWALTEKTITKPFKRNCIQRPKRTMSWMIWFSISTLM